MSDTVQVVSANLERIRAKYERKGQSTAWGDATRQEFLRAFSMVPIECLGYVVDELLLNPPRDDRGREVNYLPDPSDVVTIARRMADEGEGNSVAAAVAEIWREISGTGYVGTPKLSPLAWAIVQTMGGWYSVCTEPGVHGVLQGQMLKIGEQLVQSEKQRPLFAPTESPALRLESEGRRESRGGKLERIGA